MPCSDSTPRTDTPTVLIVDFGSQYVQLIARRVRDHHVRGIIVPSTITVDELRRWNAVGLVFSGGPASVYEADAPRCDPELLEVGLPVLGICYGMQLACLLGGGRVAAAPGREFGRANLTITKPSRLLAHLPESSVVWMSHGDVVTELSNDFEAIARTPHTPFAAVRHLHRPIFGVQFHPEVTHTPHGGQILRNFLYDICGCKGDWNVTHIAERMIRSVREQVGETDQVICGLSGGVDSSVAASIIHRAVGDRLTCLFVDNGLMRHREADLVEATFREHFHMNLLVIDAADRFLSRLEGVVDPREKRTIIGHEFVEVFKEAARRFPRAHFLAQGTVYPDVIESGRSVGGLSATIKLHHNVGALPAELGFELVEPLRELFKDEVRRVGDYLGLPEEIVWRHPFPGPGLAVRILGAVTRDRLAMLRAADDIILDELRAAGWYRKVAQAFGVLLPVSTTGVMGDDRAYAGQNVVAVRMVESADFMTADWVHVDGELLGRMAARIMNEVRGVNRVVYDVSSKPPATIEWE